MPQKLAGRTGVLAEDESVRRSFLLHASRSVRRVVDSDVEHEARAASAPFVALASVLSESMTAVDIAPSLVESHGRLVLVARHVGNMLLTDVADVGHLS